MKTNLSTYNTILRKSIRFAKQNYYEDIFETSKSCMKKTLKKTWQHINSILNRRKVSMTITGCFCIDGSVVSDPKINAEAFNIFFINVGPSLASKLSNTPVDVKLDDFLFVTPDCTVNFNMVNPEIVGNAIESLEPKTSWGYEQLTSVMLKSVKNELLHPLTVIINQFICRGIFPSKLKISKVIPVFKRR